ncbi:DDE transposase [Sulfuriferula plumbiphila]|uniref:DDE transposase n=1 Tax=Sulfuriferula plumbiphila TaxID=171865 RepID=A0A512L6T3_9PROT|nr:DDE transposase [Sulfuriferula plumbiphila]GEP30189.1 DDE transposase [Sulfuriferula plumbiphila]
MFTVKRLEDFVPKAHPLRDIRDILNTALRQMDAGFNAMYAASGRYSIAPEKLLRALVLQTLYGIRSERQLCEHLEYNLLYRWFVGLSMDDAVWDHSSFTTNRDRLIEHDAVRSLFGQIVAQADAAGLLSDEHFSVDGTLIRAWASNKSLVPRDGEPPPSGGAKHNPEVDFKGQRRNNDTHVSKTDPDALLARKSKNEGAYPSYTGHVLMENRNGLAVDVRLTQATGRAEREAALDMLKDQARAQTVGADKNYDTHGFVAACREHGITPHVARNTARRGGSAIDGRTTRHAGYGISQVIRKLIETHFGDKKQHRGGRQVKVRSLAKVDFVFTLGGAVTDLVRMARLLGPPQAA